MSGFFSPKYPSKYAGNVFKIKYRSSWELRFMEFCDVNAQIVQWVSETLTIPYHLQGKLHRYFPDFMIKVKQPDGSFESFLIEVKPKAQTKPPIPPNDLTDKKKVERYNESCLVYMKNMAKWDAAKVWCDARGISFVILTESELFERFSK